MKFTLFALCLAFCGCFATPVVVTENKVQKRSIGEEWLGGYYEGSLASAALAVPSVSSVALSAPSITSHTHTHSTAVIDRPYPVPIHSPVITSTSILPSTLSSYKYGLGSYPYSFGYPYGSLGYGANYYSGFGKYYSSYPTIYKRSLFTAPSYKYKW